MWLFCLALVLVFWFVLVILVLDFDLIAIVICSLRLFCVFKLVCLCSGCASVVYVMFWWGCFVLIGWCCSYCWFDFAVILFVYCLASLSVVDVFVLIVLWQRCCVDEWFWFVWLSTFYLCLQFVTFCLCGFVRLFVWICLAWLIVGFDILISCLILLGCFVVVLLCLLVGDLLVSLLVWLVGYVSLLLFVERL